MQSVWNAVRGLFGALRRFVRRATDPFPVSLLGLLLAAVSWAALERYAFAEMDVVLLVVGWSGIGLVAISTVLVVLAALWIKIPRRHTRRDGPLVTETRQPTLTGFHLPSLGWLPLIQVTWEWDRPTGARVEPARRFGRLDEEVTVWDRGEIRGVRRRIVVQDALGLARIGLRKNDPLMLEVMPHVGGLRQMPVLSSLAGGDELPHPMGLEDGDRVELRRYVPGDPARFIHWKIFGRTRKLMVRVPERALTRARRTVAYQVAGPDDDATAAAARVAIEGEAFGGEWVFSADGAQHDATTVDDALELVVRSSGARDRGGKGLRAFVDRAERAGPAALVVFAPPRPGPWLEEVVALARTRPRGARVVIGVDGLAKAEPGPWWRRALTLRRPPPGVPPEELDAIVKPLSAARCEVVLFDRPSGRQLGSAHRRAAVASAQVKPRRAKTARERAA